MGQCLLVHKGPQREVVHVSLPDGAVLIFDSLPSVRNQPKLQDHGHWPRVLSS